MGLLLPAVLLASAVCCGGAGVYAAGYSSAGGAQAHDSDLQDLIDALWEMDADGDGLLEAEEIPGEAREGLRLWALLAGLDASRPLPIEALEQAIWEVYGEDSDQPLQVLSPQALPSGGGAGASGQSFGQVEELPPVPGFGLEAEAMAGMARADVEAAAEWLRQFDRNNDGFIDRREARRTGWGDDPFRYDANGDDRLGQYELAQRSEATRRGGRGAGPGGRPATDPRGRQAAQPRQQSRSSAGSRGRGQVDAGDQGEQQTEGDAWYVSGTMLQRYDSDRNGALDRTESRGLGPEAASADADGDGRIDRAELAAWVEQVAVPTIDELPPQVPQWFRDRDANSDGQVTMAEFADDWTQEKVDDFARRDANDDGFITLEECLDMEAAGIGTYGNQQLQIIPARRTVYSEIAVSDAKPVADLNVQISITHSNDSQLDVFLISPSGKRVELFTSVGGNGDHFDNTILDDEAPTPINAARPPFRGAYRPEATVRNQPSLKQFYGKSIEGTWTLMIGAERASRPGVLQGWSLIATPAENHE